MKVLAGRGFTQDHLSSRAKRGIYLPCPCGRPLSGVGRSLVASLLGMTTKEARDDNKEGMTGLLLPYLLHYRRQLGPRLGHGLTMRVGGRGHAALLRTVAVERAGN